MIEFTKQELEALRGILNNVSAKGKDDLRLLLGLIEKVEAALVAPLETYQK